MSDDKSLTLPFIFYANISNNLFFFGDHAHGKEKSKGSGISQPLSQVFHTPVQKGRGDHLETKGHEMH